MKKRGSRRKYEYVERENVKVVDSAVDVREKELPVCVCASGKTFLSCCVLVTERGRGAK